MKRHLTLLALSLGSAALAQTTTSAQDVSSTQPSTTTTGETAQNALPPGFYPIEINPDIVLNKGATRGVAYVLTRDLKLVMNVTEAGGVYRAEAAGRVLRFRPGQRTGTFQGNPYRLAGTPIRLSESGLMPLSDITKLGCTYQPLEAFAPVRSFLITCNHTRTQAVLSGMTF